MIIEKNVPGPLKKAIGISAGEGLCIRSKYYVGRLNGPTHLRLNIESLRLNIIYSQAIHNAMR